MDIHETADTPHTSPPSVTSPTSVGRPPVTPRTAEEQKKILDNAVVIAHRNATRTAAKPIAAATVGLLVKPKPGLTQDQIDEHERRQAVQDQLERVAECRRRCPVPPKYQGLVLGDTSRLPTDAVAGYTEAARKLLLLLTRPALVAMIGVPGTGKTSMAWALIQRFLDDGRSAKYLKAADYIDLVRSTWGTSSGTSQIKVQADHVRPALLVLDEMQVRGETQSEDMLLLRLIDKRYDEGRATLLLSNHETRQDLLDRLDRRLVSRMRDGGGVIITDWQDMRGRIAK